MMHRLLYLIPEAFEAIGRGAVSLTPPGLRVTNAPLRFDSARPSRRQLVPASCLSETRRWYAQFGAEAGRMSRHVVGHILHAGGHAARLRAAGHEHVQR